MNYKLTLSYDGSRYKGWQKQGNTDNTIQAKVESVLSGITGEVIEVSGCGRTDAGVHAREQVCSFRSDTDLSCAQMLELMRKYLPEDIGAIALETAEPRFHARLSCREKSYRYIVRNSDIPDVFSRKFSYKYSEMLDVAAMREASKLLLGTHDFAGFSSLKSCKKSTVRTIYDVDISEEDNVVSILLTGDGFLYNMVRIIVGTLLEIGSGKMRSETISEVLETKCRETAGFTAPPQGLFLWKINY